VWNNNGHNNAHSQSPIALPIAIRVASPVGVRWPGTAAIRLITVRRAIAIIRIIITVTISRIVSVRIIAARISTTVTTARIATARVVSTRIITVRRVIWRVVRSCAAIAMKVKDCKSHRLRYDISTKISQVIKKFHRICKFFEEIRFENLRVQIIL